MIQFLYNLKKNSLFWFILAIFSLSISGFYSLFVALMRVPFIYNIFYYPDFFKTSLVIHVTLSINIFFILFIFFIWFEDLKKILIKKNKEYYLILISSIALISILLISASGFIKNSISLTINYIPIINNLVFIFGISIFFSLFLCFLFLYFYEFLLPNIKNFFQSLYLNLNFFIFFSAFIAFLCLILYILRIKLLSSNFDLEEFFWGFGHILQFTFIEVSILLIYIIFQKHSLFSDLAISKKNKIYFQILSVIKFITLFIAPFFYIFNDFNTYFTIHMRYGLLIFLLPINLYFFYYLIHRKVIQTKYSNYTIIGYILSILLCAFGGVTGYFIKEINVTIPAHYHGSLISITIICMIFLYSFIEHINQKFFLKDTIRRIINIQLILYSVGHFMHISGLIMMGGYGALRKTPGYISSESIKSISTIIAKYIFFFGSIMSLIGGLMFIIIGFYILYKNKNKTNY